MKEIAVRTRSRCAFVNIDGQVQAAVEASGVQRGVCHVFVPHTTAGITINENADPDVVRDLETILERAVPWQAGYAHAEGNAAAHAKASMMGFCQTVLIESGRLALGVWQSLYLCEFDGPRTRKLWITIQPI
ncbi:MAG TPA: secondary thiamine-phosphate synthase enzyme YjbQ [Candidatus Hydrogenedentes bacterium]|nr:secondary thiamine-phosphate synthase enzyme YjbQ [Candidatus Hydrogenedentota bacterium]HPG68217.1 secondary thiamine-phosphate synthase enzyme YjbQ [Candidatus Hydrogenedentota bacterium]